MHEIIILSILIRFIGEEQNRKRSICILPAILLTALTAVPALTASAADCAAGSVDLIEGTYAPNQVIVRFRDSAIHTDSAPRKGDIASVGADFGEMMDASSDEDIAYSAADEEIAILTKSLGSGFTLEDTLVFGDTA